MKNKGNCVWGDLDMAIKRKPKMRNWISVNNCENKAIRTNYVKAKIGNMQENNKCKPYGDSN